MLYRTVSTVSNKSVKDEEPFHPAKYVPRLLQDFILGESLGKGGFGEIIKATHKYDRNQVAIKIIKYEADEDSFKKTCREANILAKLSHPNIVRYFNSWAETAKVPLAEYEQFNQDSTSAESLSSEIKKLTQDGYINENDVILDEDDVDDDEDDEDDDEQEDQEGEDSDDSIVFRSDPEEIKELHYLFIQMELCDKRTLRNAIDDNLYLEEAKVTKYFREICEGLSYIHQADVVHRDLTPENIFLTCGDVIKIGDFGLSKQISLKNGLDAFECEENLRELACASLTAPCGTSVYIAPEFFFRAYSTVKADMYSLGVIYFEMCSPPMTQMEKLEIFPLTFETLNTLHFLTYKKKYLLRNLLHPIDLQRHTCEQILKIIKSDKSIEEVRAMIQQSRRVPRQQFNLFDKVLKSKTLHRIDLTNFFFTTAVKIFELHGGRNISMPTFLPSFNNFPDNLTTLLNTSGNSTSIANTSRLAFSYHVAKNNIMKLRRYSTEKVFKEGQFWPSESQECVFQAVSPEQNDHMLNAELLYIGREICDNILAESTRNRVRFLLNHHLIFKNILQHCRITDNLATIFTDFVLKTPNGLLRSALYQLHLSPEVERFLLTMFSCFQIQDAEIQIRLAMKANRRNGLFAGVNDNCLDIAFSQINDIVAKAEKFGIGLENIFLKPLLINERHSRGFMFKITYGYSYFTVLASGGDFDAVIRRCCGKEGIELCCSACEISFNVAKSLKLLSSDQCARVVDVVIVADDKAMAIPIFRELLSQNIKCEIVKELLLSYHNHQQPMIVIKLNEEDYGVVYQLEKSNSVLTEIYTGNLRSLILNFYRELKNLPRRRAQLTWRLNWIRSNSQLN